MLELYLTDVRSPHAGHKIGCVAARAGGGRGAGLSGSDCLSGLAAASHGPLPASSRLPARCAGRVLPLKIKNKKTKST